MSEIDELCQKRPEGFLSIVEIEPGAPRPDPNIRRRMGEHKQRLRAPRRLMSVVTESVLIRGAATALKWISPPPPGEENVIFSTFDEAAEWAERQRGAALPLRELRAEVKARLRARSARGA
jgi:hypothetical protein